MDHGHGNPLSMTSGQIRLYLRAIARSERRHEAAQAGIIRMAVWADEQAFSEAMGSLADAGEGGDADAGDD